MLNRILNTNTKKWIFVIISLSIMAIIVFLVTRSSVPEELPQTTPTTNKAQAQYEKLTPGTSSQQEVIDMLGEPSSTTSSNDSETLNYKSNNPNFDNQLTIQNDQLEFVKQIVTLQDKITTTDLREKYGPTNYVLYGSEATIGFYLYIYPGQGVAYIGHEQSGIVKEIWYFPPTDFSSFKKLYSHGFFDTIQPKQ